MLSTGDCVLVRELRREADHVFVRRDEIQPGTGASFLLPLHTTYLNSHVMEDPRLAASSTLYEAWYCRVIDRPAEPEHDASLSQKTHPGFTITCQTCGSTDVVVENTLGWSSQSGAWGSIDLSCNDCTNSSPLFEPYD